MRRTALFFLPLLLISLAPRARGEDNPDFPQIHPQPNSSQSAAQQPNPAYGTQNMAGVANPNQGASPNGAQIGGGTQGNATGVPSGKSGRMLHNDIAPAMAPSTPDTPDPAPGPLSFDDALANFTTVVETYVANKSPKGYWPFTEKIVGKKPHAWRLAKPKVKEDSVKKLSGEKYTGRVSFRDVRGGRPPSLEFVVDFSGVEWKVLSVKPAAKPVKER